jgi:hypothetical protein
MSHSSTFVNSSEGERNGQPEVFESIRQLEMGMLEEEWGPSKDTNGGGHILKDSLENSVEMIGKAMQGMNRETSEGLEREDRKIGENGGHNEEP